jgi:hypothetical protein
MRHSIKELSGKMICRTSNDVISETLCSSMLQTKQKAIFDFDSINLQKWILKNAFLIHSSKKNVHKIYENIFHVRENYF